MKRSSRRSNRYRVILLGAIVAVTTTVVLRVTSANTTPGPKNVVTGAATDRHLSVSSLAPADHIHAIEQLLSPASKIAPAVVAETARGTSASVVIMLAEQADVSDAYKIEDQDERGWFVYNALTRHAEASQADLKRFLKSRNIEYQSFWAANMIVATADQTLVNEVAGRFDVARIDSNQPARWIEDPQITKPSPALNVPETIEAGVSNVNAPSVWALGFTGQGIVVANQDTGMRWTHNAIKPKYRGWNGTTADHNFNWHDSIHTQIPGSAAVNPCGRNLVAPCDDNAHGTHTTGTTVGDDGAGNQIGVAPGAKWIGCRNMDSGNGTPATYTECFQFFMAPTDLNNNNANPTLRPHVMNNSWGCPASEGCTTQAELETIVNNTQASGIFVVVSAGNDGPNCSTVSNGAQAGPPSVYEASFSVGAISAATNTLASFSSRGPSLFYNPNLLKPNISAPGVSVKSATNVSDTNYQSFNGTSMAGPHVVGVVALLWSARPQLVRNIAATKALLQSTANPAVTVTSQTCGGIPSTQIPNNSFGYGRVDALAAVNALPTISGRLLYQDTTRGARNVTITLTGSNGFATRTTTTDTNGYYVFTGVPIGNDYTITPSRNPETHDSGITALDASLAAQFSLNTISLTPNQQVAADTSNNSTVSAFDASEIACYQLQIDRPGSMAGSWKFIPASLSLSNLSGDQANQNATAIMIGDVTGNATPAMPRPVIASPEGIASIPVSLPIKQDPPGGPSTIPITVGNTTGQDVFAYDFDIQFDPSVLSLQATPVDATGTLSAGWSVNSNSSTPGHIIVNAFNTTAMSGQGVLLYLKFNVIGGAGSTSPLTIVSFNFNEGAPGDTDINGSFTAGSPSASASRISGQILSATGSPVAGTTVTILGSTRTVRAITDSHGNYHVDGLDTGGFYTVTPARANYSFAPVSRSFSLVADNTNAVFTGTQHDDATSPLESPEFFVRQHYLDFLGREPEQAGLDFWSGQLRACGTDELCLRQRRVDVSAEFFITREFQDSGSFIINLYKAGLGRQPAYSEYASGRQQVVGGSLIEQEKTEFENTFVKRPDFLGLYPSNLGREAFVDALIQRIDNVSGIDLSSSRDNLLAQYELGSSTNESRSFVLRQIVEDAEFRQAQYNSSFVLSEYFSYLGRNPDQAGYNFWLNVLNNSDRNNYRGMVCSFVTSAEYQHRFGAAAPSSNSECQ